MSREFWIGIVISGVLSLVLGIIGALLTPVIKDWYKGWGKTKEAARTERYKDDYAETLYYVEFPEKFTQFLVRKAITMLVAMGIWLMSTFMMLLVILTRLILQIRDTTISLQNVHALRGILLLSVVMSSIAYGIAMIAFRRVSRLWHVVNKFDLFLATFPDEVRDREVEEHLLRMHKVMSSKLS